MPSKKKKAVDFEIKFVQFEERLQNEYLLWAGDRKLTLVDGILDLAEHRVKISFSLNQDDGSWLCTATPKDEKWLSYGIVFMFRHGDLVKVVHMAQFYLMEVLGAGELDVPIDNNFNW